MNNFMRALVAMVLLLSIHAPAGATDPGRGQNLHQEHCVACHSSLTGGQPDNLYTRSDRRVTSLAGLREQVRRCELSLGLRWFDEDIEEVTAFLNRDFYHFGK